MTTITAHEAKQLAINTAMPIAQKELALIYPLIQIAAKQGYRKTRLRSSFWLYHANVTSEAYRIAVEQLNADGFSVSYSYINSNHGESGTLISW